MNTSVYSRTRRMTALLTCLAALSPVLAACSATAMPTPTGTGTSPRAPASGPRLDPRPASLPSPLLVYSTYKNLAMPLVPPPEPTLPPCSPFSLDQPRPFIFHPPHFGQSP